MVFQDQVQIQYFQQLHQLEVEVVLLGEQLTDLQVMVDQVEEQIEEVILHHKLVLVIHHQYHHHKVILEIIIQVQ
ncbi:MAG: hypothetical protein CME98_21930 [Hyphomonas sp.]|nr:hypothetical protein [Hyphomonas sp.]